MMVAIGLSYIAFTMLRYIPSIPRFLRPFIMKLYWILSKVFFSIYWDVQVVFVFASINVLYYIFIFACVEPLLHLWDEADLFVLNDLSDMLLDFIEDFLLFILLRILLRIFCCLFYWGFLHCCSLRRLAYSSSFSRYLVWFWDDCNTGFIKWVMQLQYSFPLYFVEEFKEGWY
jgi:hypothetical protein